MCLCLWENKIIEFLLFTHFNQKLWTLEHYRLRRKTKQGKSKALRSLLLPIGSRKKYVRIKFCVIHSVVSISGTVNVCSPGRSQPASPWRGSWTGRLPLVPDWRGRWDNSWSDQAGLSGSERKAVVPSPLWSCEESLAAMVPFSTGNCQ